MTLYLGMLVDIILFVLFSLSVVLIYSLMMINVQVHCGCVRVCVCDALSQFNVYDAMCPSSRPQ